MVCLSAISKMTEWFKDRNIKATKMGWSSLCGRQQALSTSLSLALCVSSLRCWSCLAVSPMKAAVSSHPVLWLWVWTVGPDNVESVNPASAPDNFNVLCHSVLISLAKAEAPLIRFALEIRNPENLGSCYLFLLRGAVLLWPTTVSTGIHSCKLTLTFNKDCGLGSEEGQIWGR